MADAAGPGAARGIGPVVIPAPNGAGHSAHAEHNGDDSVATTCPGVATANGRRRRVHGPPMATTDSGRSTTPVASRVNEEKSVNLIETRSDPAIAAPRQPSRTAPLRRARECGASPALHRPIGLTPGKRAMNRWIRRIVPALSLALSAGAAHAGVTITDAWVRGTVQGQSATGVFMTISSTEDTTLTGASTPIAGKADLHRMVMEQGMMKMRPVTSIHVPANGMVQLSPGGTDSYHVMLMGLKQPLTVGQKVPVTLTFKGGDGKVTSTRVEAEVRALSDPHSGMKMK
jgi:copper(I)-binding protein